MLRIFLVVGILMCTGAGFAAFAQMNPGSKGAGMPQAAAQYLANAPSRLVTLLFADSEDSARPRKAQLPQTRGVNARGNTSLAERKLRATARKMVDSSPTARADRDARRADSEERWWSRFNRKAPSADASNGRLDAVQSRARDEAAERQRWQAMIKAAGG